MEGSTGEFPPSLVFKGLVSFLPVTTGYYYLLIIQGHTQRGVPPEMELEVEPLQDLSEVEKGNVPRNSWFLSSESPESE